MLWDRGGATVRVATAAGPIPSTRDRSSLALLRDRPSGPPVTACATPRCLPRPRNHSLPRAPAARTSRKARPRATRPQGSRAADAGGATWRFRPRRGRGARGGRGPARCADQLHEAVERDHPGRASNRVGARSPVGQGHEHMSDVRDGALEPRLGQGVQPELPRVGRCVGVTLGAENGAHAPPHFVSGVLRPAPGPAQ
jgi:hypothetical protein